MHQGIQDVEGLYLFKVCSDPVFFGREAFVSL